jgi:hypothetical protein
MIGDRSRRHWTDADRDRRSSGPDDPGSTTGDFRGRIYVHIQVIVGENNGTEPCVRPRKRRVRGEYSEHASGSNPPFVPLDRSVVSVEFVDCEITFTPV